MSNMIDKRIDAILLRKGLITRATSKRLQEDWARVAKEGPRVLSYPNFVRGMLFDDIQPLIGRFEILGTLCCTICEVPRRAENQKEASLRDP